MFNIKQLMISLGQFSWDDDLAAVAALASFSRAFAPCPPSTAMLGSWTFMLLHHALQVASIGIPVQPSGAWQ